MPNLSQPNQGTRPPVTLYVISLHIQYMYLTSFRLIGTGKRRAGRELLSDFVHKSLEFRPLIEVLSKYLPLGVDLGNHDLFVVDLEGLTSRKIQFNVYLGVA